MKTCGTLLRILAVLVAFVCTAVMFVNYSITMEEYDEYIEELQEEREEHEEYYTLYGEEHDSDCSTCEEYDEDEKYYDRAITRTTMSLVQNISLYVVYACILFAVGQLVANKGKKAEAVQAPAGTMPCPNCGNTLRADARFCGRCGTIIGN